MQELSPTPPPDDAANAGTSGSVSWTKWLEALEQCMIPYFEKTDFNTSEISIAKKQAFQMNF